MKKGLILPVLALALVAGACEEDDDSMGVGTQANVRFVNAITGVTGNLALTANGAMVGSAQLANNWVSGAVAAMLNDRGLDFAASPVSADAVGKLLLRIEDGTISAKAGKDVLLAMADGPGDPDTVIARLGLRQISDVGALEAAVDAVLAANARQVEDYRAGKEKAFNSLVGQVMKATRGKANPAQVNEILRRRLSGG